jgi:hypothetical protein
MKTRIKVKDRYRVTITNNEAPPKFRTWSEDGMFTSVRDAKSKKLHKYAVEYSTSLNLAEPVGSIKKRLREADGGDMFKVKVEKL